MEAVTRFRCKGCGGTTYNTAVVGEKALHVRVRHSVGCSVRRAWEEAFPYLYANYKAEETGVSV